MIIKDKSQAADQGTHGPILLAAWEAGETRVKVGGKEYEFVREPEPMEMYTGEELLAKALESHPEWRREQSAAAHRFMETVRDLALDRRVEMLRATDDDDLVDKLVYTLAALPNPARGAVDALHLVREHIEANRPVLTNEIVTDWYNERRRLGECCLDVLKVVAHRAAEYRSPPKGRAEKLGAIADSLPVSEEADAEVGRIMMATEERNEYQEIESSAVAGLRAENERLKRRAGESNG
jgi:hypothetical protein